METAGMATRGTGSTRTGPVQRALCLVEATARLSSVSMTAVVTRSMLTALEIGPAKFRGS